MNIFVLDPNPRIAAKYHCDKHVVKMILETAQMLCTSLRKNCEDYITRTQEYSQHITECESCAMEAGMADFDEEKWINDCLDLMPKIPYKSTHKNHPCTIWSGESSANFSWLLALGIELCKEYTLRYGKVHKTTAVFDFIVENRNYIANLFTSHDFTELPQAMPDDYKHEDVITAYRNYYIAEKSSIAQWNKCTPAPEWFTSGKTEPEPKITFLQFLKSLRK